MSNISRRKFALQADPVDSRDFIYKALAPRKAYPESTFQQNLRAYLSRYKIDNQENQGACAAFSYREAMRRILQINKMSDFNPSPQFMYYVARNNKRRDEGLVLRNLMKAMVKFGACRELLWPYKEANLTKEPTPAAYKDARYHQLIRYESIGQTESEIKDAICNGLPIIYGKAIYESFMSKETAHTGIIPIPKAGEKLHGWHAQTILDYEPKGGIELNHWGTQWGMDGVNLTPWEFLLNPKLARDFWVIYLTE